MRACSTYYTLFAAFAFVFHWRHVPANVDVADAGSSNGSVPKVILIMLGDDYGFNNVGFPHGPMGPNYGRGNPEMRTPNLDALTRDGIILDRHMSTSPLAQLHQVISRKKNHRPLNHTHRHYVYKYCSPTRSSLMSGREPPRVNQNNLNNHIYATSGPDLRFTLLPAKMKEAGFTTAMVGKSHLGARSPSNLPINRGFDYHFGFLKGGEDHYSQGSGDNHVDLWNDHYLANDSGIYSGYLYTSKAVEVIRNFSKLSVPRGLFLYLAWHNTHTPLECPPEFMYPSLPSYNNSFQSRMTYNCMSRILDDGVGNVTKALKDANLWKDTLLLFSADNGGWAGNSGSNNYPLHFYREDTCRKIYESTFSVYLTLRYGTLTRLVGADPTDDVPGLPPVDSVDVWASFLVPNATSTKREDIWLSWSCTNATAAVVGCDPETPSIYNTSGDPTHGQGPGDMGYISKNYKIVVGYQQGRGIWFGPVYPNGTKDYKDNSCVKGCLFDIVKDPTEHKNLKDTLPLVWKVMVEKLLQAGKTLYQTNYADPNASECLTQSQADRLYIGHNKCIYGGPGYQPSLPSPACNVTTPRLYLGPLCFRTLPPLPPAPSPSPSPPAMGPVLMLCVPGTQCGQRGKGQCLVTSGVSKAPLAMGECIDDQGWRSNVHVSNWVEWFDRKRGGSLGFLKLNETGHTTISGFCQRAEVYINPDEPSEPGKTRQGFAIRNSTTVPLAVDLISSICFDGKNNKTPQCLGISKGATVPSIMRCDHPDYSPWPVVQWQEQQYMTTEPLGQTEFVFDPQPPVKIVQTEQSDEYVYFPQTLHLIGNRSLLLSFQTLSDALHIDGWSGRHFGGDINNLSTWTEVLRGEGTGQWLVKPCVLDNDGKSALCYTYDTRRFLPGDARNAWLRSLHFDVDISSPHILSIKDGPNITIDMGANDSHWLAPWGQNTTNLMVTDGNIIQLVDPSKPAQQQDGVLLTTLYGSYVNQTQGSVIAALHSYNNGLTWKFYSTVATNHAVPECMVPTENHLLRLHNGTLMLVFRSGGTSNPLCMTTSTDNGRTWSPARPMVAAVPAPGSGNRWVWGVEPKLVQLSNGVLVLSTGRPGVMLWVSDASAAVWSSFNVAISHNKAVDKNFRYSSAFPSSKETTSYTGLVAIPDTNSVLVSYDFLGNGWSPAPITKPSAIFVMQVGISSTSN